MSQQRTRDDVGEGLGGALEALRVPALHDLDLDAENSLAEEDVANGLVDEVANRLNETEVSD